LKRSGPHRASWFRTWIPLVLVLVEALVHQTLADTALPSLSGPDSLQVLSGETLSFFVRIQPVEGGANP